MALEPVTLNDGNQIPPIAYGTGSKMKFHDITQYIELAIEVGFSHIDTAVFYQTEKYVGRAIKESGLARTELFVTTKFLQGLLVQRDVRKSLANLGLQYLDLYLIHQPRLISNLAETWKEFEKVQQDGLAKSIGVSNLVNVEQLEDLIKVSKVKPAVNQIQLHPYNYHEMKPIMDACAKHNIVIEAYSSLAPLTTYPDGPVDEPLNAAAKRIGASPTQVIFLWVRAKGAVIITTSTTRAHMEEYIAIGDLPALTEDEIASIDNAGANGPPSRSMIMKHTTLAVAFVILLMMNVCFGFGRMG
ncbi:2,5-diketo-D-gluconic acid reductase [Lentinula raphanica]|nr:2,5-diketo-D-gluconic acid reductase [Lentinula raphanica]